MSLYTLYSLQVVASELFGSAADETTPPEDHTPYSSEEEASEPSDSEEEDDQSCDEVPQLPSLLATEKRGTEMRLSGLVMSDGVGVGRCASVRVTLQCTRCRSQQDETIRAERCEENKSDLYSHKTFISCFSLPLLPSLPPSLPPSPSPSLPPSLSSPASQLCSKCQHCYSFSYRPSMFHSTSPALGFLDLQG